MKALFVCQGKSLELFFELHGISRERLGITEAAYYVADSVHYADFVKSHPSFEREARVLKEWEIMSVALKAAPDEKYLRELEARCGAPTLWPALFCDRRIVNGTFCKVTQDYAPRFDHGRMRLILQEAGRAIERLFDEFAPDLVTAFVPVTFGDYLFWLVAKSRGIKYLQLKSTKIKNYVTFSENVHEQFDHVYETMHTLESEPDDNPWKKEASEYLRRAREKQAVYEGILVKQKAESPLLRYARPLKSLPRVIAEEIRYRNGPGAADNHVPPPLGTFLISNYATPARAAQMRKITKPRTISPSELDALDYVFYPLHSEPEIALSIYGRPYLNQIELIRNLAMALPVSMKLALKEHPRSMGFRSSKYYERLMEIPNACFVPVETPPREIVLRAKAVAIVSGFIGFEALMLGKPVVTFGKCPFNALEGRALKHIRDPWQIGDGIADLISNYEYDEAALVNYVAASMARSVPVDLYSTILAKSGRKSMTADSRKDQFTRLAKYYALRVREISDK